MKYKWKDDRNGLLVSTVRAELLIKLNYNMKCEELYSFVKKITNIYYHSSNGKINSAH